MLYRLSTIVQRVANKAIVDETKSGGTGPMEIVASGFDAELNATWQDESMPWHCYVVRDDGVSIDVLGHLRTRRFFSQGRTWRDPHVFEQEFWVIPVRTSEDSKKVGLGMINRAIDMHWREMAKLDPTVFSRATVPRPGRDGHGELYYARWVKKYLDAVEAHGQRYMKHLLADHPGWKAQLIRDTIYDAGRWEPKLMKDRPGPGKAGGEMTEHCQRILAADMNKGEHT
jgi:hypothetical protein